MTISNTTSYALVVEKLLENPDVRPHPLLLHMCQSDTDADQLAEELKYQVDILRDVDLTRADKASNLLCCLAELTAKPTHRALALRAKGNVLCLGKHEHQQAITLYDEATNIYRSQGDSINAAKSQVGKVWALTCLGKNAEAIETGKQIIPVLQTHEQWIQLAHVYLNMANVLSRQGDDQAALHWLDQAAHVYEQQGDEGLVNLPRTENNRAISLRNIGCFDESIAASNRAIQSFDSLTKPIEAARGKQNLAATFIIQGKLNEALKLRDHVVHVFHKDGRLYDAMLVELEISSAYLYMRRFADALDMCCQARTRFNDQQMYLEVAQALVNEAIARAGLRAYAEALDTLDEARYMFEQMGSAFWVTVTDLEKAIIFYHQGQFASSLHRAQICADTFATSDIPVKEAYARLIAARSALMLNRTNQAHDFLKRAYDLASDIPSLVYQVHHLRGLLAEQHGKGDLALSEYHRAIESFEMVRGQLMIEFRADFLEDKQVIYEDTVQLYLNTNQPEQALECAERAKSRALRDLLAYQLDLSIQPRASADETLVQELEQMQTARARWFRRSLGNVETSETEGGGAPSPEEHRQQAQREIARLEQQITNLWHVLLIRNAGYARDASLWQFHPEPIQPYLDTNSLLIEYFFCHGKIIVFLVTKHDVQYHILSCNATQVQQALEKLMLHLKSAPRAAHSSDKLATLMKKTQGHLHQLYQMLIAPFAELLNRYPRLIIVPHGSTLHHLPFHALHNGEGFLIEQHEISYLPAANILRYCYDHRPTQGGLVAFGHSYHERLPYTIQEVQTITRACGGKAFLEQDVTLEQVRTAACEANILHLATHGHFHKDNPLFSGLHLEDGQLTTLDIFNLKINASLVTLSACQTGLNKVHGGDELLGLTRAFLYAGAASLVLSLWKVADDSTARLMSTFYQKLIKGATRGAALRHAQLELLSERNQAYAHPYFWAPFFLIGNTDSLAILDGNFSSNGTHPPQR